MEVNASAVDLAASSQPPVQFGFANLDATTGEVAHISYTVGPFGAAARDAQASTPKKSAAAQLARREALAAAAAAQKRQQLAELLAHFDADHSGALSYDQFVLFFRAMDSGAALTQAEFDELCASLEMAPAVGVTSLEAFFPESSDAEAVRKLHDTVLGVAAAAPDPFTALGSSGGAGAAGAAAGGRRDWRDQTGGVGRAELEPEPELDLRRGGPIVVQFEALDRAIAGGLALGKAVLICDPTERASQFLSYQSCELLDCKGLFVLDKLHKRPREVILT